jgi:hypothetical protein
MSGGLPGWTDNVRSWRAAHKSRVFGRKVCASPGGMKMVRLLETVPVVQHFRTAARLHKEDRRVDA